MNRYSKIIRSLRTLNRIACKDLTRAVIIVIRSIPAMFLRVFYFRCFYGEKGSLINKCFNAVNGCSPFFRELSQSAERACQIGIMGENLCALPVFKACELKSSQVRPDFRKKVTDVEEMLRIHRFRWLRNITCDQDRQDGYELILEWINLPCDEKGKSLDSYSISERIVSWIIHICFTQDRNNEVLERIAASMQSQIDLLLSKPDFLQIFTNNHIINNARCLYISGTALGIPELRETGLLILRESMPRLVRGGFLQEDSTHYQLLVTSWIMEVTFFARSFGDNEALEFLKDFSGRMLGVCRLFADGRTKGEYPLFGDISPDTEPGYFMGQPFVGTGTSPWAGLFGVDFSCYKPEGIEPYSNGFRHMKSSNFELVMIEKHAGCRSHGHNDNASFTLYYKGKSVISDPGLSDYGTDLVTMQQISELHNTPVINGIRADLSRKTPLFTFVSFKPAGWLAEKACSMLFEQASSKILVKQDERTMNVALEYHAAGIRLNRLFHSLENGICLEDTVAGVDTMKYENKLCIPLGFTMSEKDGTYELKLKDLPIRITISFDSGLELQASETTISTAYGHRGICPFLYIHAASRDRFKVTYLIEENE